MRARPLNIDVSLDSRSETVNDLLRGVGGAMRHASAGIAALVDARDAAGGRFPIRVKSVVTKHNLSQLEELVAWVTTMPGVLIDFSPVRLWRATEIDALYPASDSEIAALDSVIDRLKIAKARGAPIETSEAKLDATRLHFQGRQNAHGVGACRVALRSVDIRPNGDVNHC